MPGRPCCHAAQMSAKAEFYHRAGISDFRIRVINMMFVTDFWAHFSFDQDKSDNAEVVGNIVLLEIPLMVN